MLSFYIVEILWSSIEPVTLLDAIKNQSIPIKIKLCGWLSIRFIALVLYFYFFTFNWLPAFCGVKFATLSFLRVHRWNDQYYSIRIDWLVMIKKLCTMIRSILLSRSYDLLIASKGNLEMASFILVFIFYLCTCWHSSTLNLSYDKDAECPLL